MPSNFLGIEIGRRALAANQIALETIGQNTSNVNTPGYTRQKVNLEATDPTPITLPNGLQGQIGTGVDVASITRVRDQYLDEQTRKALSEQGEYGATKDILARAEGVLNEPSASTVGSRLTALFNSFSDLSADPSNAGLRASARTQGQAFATAIKHLNSALKQVSSDVEQSVTLKVKQVNELATQIAKLNSEIQKSVLTGGSPNDLMDKRDSLLENLSSLIAVQVVPSKVAETGKFTGAVQVYMGGQALIYNEDTTPLPTTIDSTSASPALLDKHGKSIPLLGGEIAGLLQAKSLVDSYRADFNRLAEETLKAVNAQHAAGTALNGATGQPFFVGTDANTIDLSPAIVQSTDAIAAATTPTPPATFARGNGDNARLLARVGQSSLMGNSTLNQFYNAQVTRMGADSKRFEDLAGSQEKIVAQVRNQQTAVSGVSLDEELSKLIQYQRSYQAAARFITVMDDTLDRVINGLGR
jgi:flagellar hook-associated protein 1 FlgK